MVMKSLHLALLAALALNAQAANPPHPTLATKVRFDVVKYL
jgi:hypothetical protein